MSRFLSYKPLILFNTSAMKVVYTKRGTAFPDIFGRGLDNAVSQFGIGTSDIFGHEIVVRVTGISSMLHNRNSLKSRTFLPDDAASVDDRKRISAICGHGVDYHVEQSDDEPH